jgi:hypothetical protein
MFIRLKRISRTPYSEEITILLSDEGRFGDEQMDIGKLNVHYMADQIVGTLLIWEEHAAAFAKSPGSTLDDVIHEILTEISEPIGVPSEYGIEIYYPPLAKQDFASNYVDDEDTEPEAGNTAEALDQADGEDTPADQEPPEDDFAKQLRSHP